MDGDEWKTAKRRPVQSLKTPPRGGVPFDSYGVIDDVENTSQLAHSSPAGQERGLRERIAGTAAGYFRTLPCGATQIIQVSRRQCYRRALRDGIEKSLHASHMFRSSQSRNTRADNSREKKRNPALQH